MEPTEVQKGTLEFETTLTGWSVKIQGGSRHLLDRLMLLALMLFSLGWLGNMAVFAFMILGLAVSEGAEALFAGAMGLPFMVLPGIIALLTMYVVGGTLLQSLHDTRIEVVGTDMRIRHWRLGREQPTRLLPLAELTAPRVEGTLWRQRLWLNDEICLPVYIHTAHREQFLAMLRESCAFAQAHPEQPPQVPAALRAMLRQRAP